MMQSEQTDNLYVVSEKLDICVKVKHGGYIPRSGLLFAECLNRFDFKDCAVADIGCGETGILAHYAFNCGADPVVGADIDPSAIAHARSSSDKSSKICWIISDLFSNLNGLKFDVIFSNPPQMPMPFKRRKDLKDWHDSSGSTGRETVLRIIEESPVYLRVKGRLYVLIFDFLGVEKSFNSCPSFKKVASQYNLSCRVISSYKKNIREGGQTQKSIPWIKEIYPKYKFKKDSSGNLIYNILIVEFQKQ